MALNNDVIDLTAAAGSADEHVIGGRVNGASGNLELDMNIGGVAAIQIPLLNNMPPDEHITGARYNPGTGNIEIDLCIAGARAITFPLLNQLPRDVFISTGFYDPVTMKVTFIYSDGRKNLELDLSTIVMHEKAGANYDPNHSYSTGDIVSIPGSEVLYIALVSGVLPDPTVSPAEWKPVINKERGGVLWDPTIEYHARDIVSVNSTADVYIALNDNVNSDPLNRVDWYELGSSRHNVGLFTPDDTNPPTSEYPDVTGEEEGAVWYVSGLPPEGYTMTSGPFLGYTLHNNDKYVWYGLDVNGDDIWLWEPFPRVFGGKERGGTQWSDTIDYFVDDVVSFGQVIYIANTDNTNMNPVSSPEWTVLSLNERGGMPYNDQLPYNEGEVVSHNGIIYVAIGPVPPGHTPPDHVYWNTPTVAELGGRVWASGNTYQPGDIVTDSSDDNVYLALTPNTGEQPSITPSAWKRAGENERGGIAWSSSTMYAKGDVVIDPSVIPMTVYVSMQSNNLNHYPSDSSWWQELDSIFYNATTGGRDGSGGFQGVLHDPRDPNGEYPDFSQEQEGAIWYIYGLGIDDTTGMRNTYTFQTGGLAGTTVGDLDRIIWVQSNQGTGDPMWLWVPIPRINAERGGVAWADRCDYSKGDVVVDLVDFRAYKSTINNNHSNPPHLGSGWDPISPEERGGKPWRANEEYDVGIVVSDTSVSPTIEYMCTSNHTSSSGDTPLSGNGNWTDGFIVSNVDPGTY